MSTGFTDQIVSNNHAKDRDQPADRRNNEDQTIRERYTYARTVFVFIGEEQDVHYS